VVAGSGSAGTSLAQAYPSLGLDVPVVEATPDAFDGCGVVFLATPHEASLALAPALLAAGTAVVDLSGAYRLPAATFSAWYGLEHTSPHLAPAVYGLPELQRDRIRGQQLVANPGCYPTAALLALAPLADLVVPESVVVTGMSGTSGAGKGLRDELHFSHASGNVAPYGAPNHRHTPEIAQGWAAATGIDAGLTFTPHLVPMSRGLLCTVVADLADGAGADEVTAAYDKHYGAEPFVRLLAAGSWPSTAHVAGSNAAAVSAAVDGHTRRVIASCAIDNLVKGAAGQAVQNANLLLGLAETAGLPTAAVYP
jgi:N-acetyl-gamma-glutamyl-phosphate reductase